MYFLFSTHLVDFCLHFRDPYVPLELLRFCCSEWTEVFTSDLEGWRCLMAVHVYVEIDTLLRIIC